MSAKYTHPFSVIVPIFNDEQVIGALLERLKPVMVELAETYEIILIDDGSRDSSWTLIEQECRNDSHLVGIKLARNFGQQNAIWAGLECSTGKVLVLIDSDLQDRPEDIPKLVDALLASGASMSIARWISRQDSMLRTSLSRMFYFVSQRLTNINHQPNLGVFRAIDRSIVDEMKKHQEKTSTPLSLMYWIGADYITVDLERDKRLAGSSGYTLGKLLRLAMDRIFSFSLFPIRLATIVGSIISLLSFLAGILLIIRWLRGFVVAGWTSTVVLILFTSGVNFLFLGILGEYLARTFYEAKQRPRYIIRKKI